MQRHMLIPVGLSVLAITSFVVGVITGFQLHAFSAEKDAQYRAAMYMIESNHLEEQDGGSLHARDYANRAIGATPSWCYPRAQYAEYLRASGDLEEAAWEIQRAIDSMDIYEGPFGITEFDRNDMMRFREELREQTVTSAGTGDDVS